MEHNFTKLIIWQRAHKLVLETYKLTKEFPKNETYGITSQLRRAVSSVPANIVEGYSRRGTKEFIHFLYQARSSLDEMIYFCILSKDLKYISIDKYKPLMNKAVVLMKMLNKFISSQKQRT